MRERVRGWESEKHGGEDDTPKYIIALPVFCSCATGGSSLFQAPQNDIATHCTRGKTMRSRYVSNLEAACTMSSFVDPIDVIWDFQGEVHQGERANSTTTSTRPSTTAVVRDQLFCQTKPELLEGHPSCRAEVLPQDVSICYANIKKKVKDVLIELSALCAAVVVAAQLITSINTTHVGIVG